MRNRPDKDGWAKSAYEKAKKQIFGSHPNCAICGRPIDYHRKFPDPWSPTLDHIIPNAKGGDPVDRNNLQPAHLQCNRIKASRIPIAAEKPKAVSNRDLPLSMDWTGYRA